MSQDFGHSEQPNGDQNKSPLAMMLQDAYQKAVLIKRMDEQIAQIASKRKILCDELKAIQNQLNHEFCQLLDSDPNVQLAEVA